MRSRPSLSIIIIMPSDAPDELALGEEALGEEVPGAAAAGAGGLGGDDVWAAATTVDGSASSSRSSAAAQSRTGRRKPKGKMRTVSGAVGMAWNHGAWRSTPPE
ncbi:MAG: hypothetical protein ACLGJC_10835 [Alphaproteobacteria bacterium]